MVLLLLGLLILGMILGVVTAAWVMRRPAKSDKRRISRQTRQSKKEI